MSSEDTKRETYWCCKADYDQHEPTCRNFPHWAAAELSRLREIEKRAGDVDALGQILWLLDAPKANPDDWNKLGPGLKQPYLINARTMSGWLKGGGE